VTDKIKNHNRKSIGQENGLEFVPTSGILESMRAVKDANEISIIRKAAEIADDAFSHILHFIQPGITELDVAFELEMFMRKQGATAVGFDTIVASGKRSAMPHGVASDKKLELGDLVTLDFGALYQGYRSDITRTVVLGRPTDRQIEVYNTVLNAEQLAIDAIRVGMTGKELDGVARNYLIYKGYDGCGNGLGHGIGLEIHEEPFLSPKCELVLEPRMITTIEPGIYLSGWGGVRIEDDVLVLEDGIEILTKSPKNELIRV